MSDGITQRGSYTLMTEDEFTHYQKINSEFNKRVNNIDNQSLGPAVSIETDPTGRTQHEPGSKLDAGKERVGLVLGSFALALLEVSKVGTYGAKKYTDRGWETVPNGIERYEDAAGRHYLKRKSGEERDVDTQLLHLAHEAWNVLAQLELVLRGKK